jgi:hypothetical protein
MLPVSKGRRGIASRQIAEIEKFIVVRAIRGIIPAQFLLLPIWINQRHRQYLPMPFDSEIDTGVFRRRF